MILQIGKLFGLSMENRLLAVEATILLFVARMAVISLPFRWIAKTLGEKENPKGEIDFSPKKPDLELNRIGWTIRRIGDLTPWNSNCLAQAITAQKMLARRGRASQMYFGLKHSDEGKMEAHAWLKSGDTILTGGSEFEPYTVVAVFRKG
ncbi:MAG: lasso peptide biosynthesis B2 protein [Pyrinomonadaceae bacterium]|nr:lasso peptide biosynthesis B2 protein [Pyrinomonadaceae bacterium]